MAAAPALAGGLHAGGGLPIRERKSAFELTDPEVARLRKAYQLLRDLARTNPDDPRGWLRQANVHCWYCGGEGGNEMNAGTEIHGSWRFLPWHRMYLYMHERILATLLGDDTFTLPYWDWDTPGRNKVPPAYGETGTSADPNPLFDPIRAAAIGNFIPVDGDPNNIVGATVIAAALKPTVFDSPGGFGGTCDGSCSAPGTLEQSPHGPVHIWTADPTLSNAAPDMGVLGTAARDPIFFTHHANIDRLWDVWLNQPVAAGQPKRTNPVMSDGTINPTWATERFAFYDQGATPRWVSMAIGDTVDHETTLRYVYKGVANPARASAPRVFAAASSPLGGKVDASPASKDAIKVPVPPELSGASAPLVAAPPSRPVYVLHIDDIQVPSDQQVVVRVFVDLTAADKSTPINTPNFVGQFAILAKHRPAQAPAGAMAARPMSHGYNQAFELTDAQLALLKGKAELSVKLVALGGLTTIPYKRAYIAARR